MTTPASSQPVSHAVRISALASVRLADRLRFAAAVLVPAVLLSAYSLIPQPPYGAHPFDDMWRRHLLVGVAILVWLGALIYARRLPRSTPLLAPLILFLAIQSYSVVGASDWRIGAEPVLDLVAGIVIFAALVDCPGLSAESLRWSLMISAFCLSVACLAFIWGRLADWWSLIRAIPDTGAGLLPPTVPRVLAVGTNPNIIAPLMTLAAPLFLLSIVESRGRKRIVLVLAAVVVQIGVFFTLSRSAWAGELAGIALTLVLIAAGGVRRGPLSKAGRRRIAVAILALAAVVAVALAVAVILLSFGWRPQWLFRPTIAARTDFRGAALQMIREHPLLGSGPASFSLNYPYLSNGDPAGAVHSHNVLLEIALESGVAGLIAAALAGAGALAILTRLWRHGTGHDRLVAAAVAGALASFVVNGMADALHLFPEILFALGALMAIAVRSGADLGDELSLRPWYYRLGLNRALPLAPFALAAAMLLVWSRIDLAAGYYSRSISFASQHDWVASALEANRAHTTDPGLAIYPVQEALSLEMAQENGQDNTGRQRAIDLLNRALAVEPRSSITRLDLAPLLEADGQHLAAVDQTTLMVAGAPRDSLVLLAAGVMEEGAHPEQAIADYASAMAESPRIADSPFWQTTAFRRRNFKVIVQQALSKAEGEDSSSGPDAVRQIVSEAAGVDVPSAGQGGALVAKVDLARRLIRGGRSDEAATILAPVGRAHPDDPSIRLALGELDEARGDLRAARGEWLAGAYLGDVESIMHLGDTSPSGRVPARIRELGHWGLADLWDRQFSLAVQHYRFAYRRQEPLPIVLPGDWLNALPALYSRLQSAVDRWDAGETAQPGRQ